MISSAEPALPAFNAYVPRILMLLYTSGRMIQDSVGIYVDATGNGTIPVALIPVIHSRLVQVLVTISLVKIRFLRYSFKSQSRKTRVSPNRSPKTTKERVPTRPP